MRIPFDLIYIIPFILFILTYFALSQKIYLHNKFISAFIASSIVTGIMIFISKPSDYNKAIGCSAFLFFYVFILFIIKKTYTTINRFLIQKQWLKEKFVNKDYTWVEVTDWGDDMWDKKIAAPPSWLDHTLTIVLLLLPMLLVVALLRLLNFLF
jgi:hypothetical protein